MSRMAWGLALLAAGSAVWSQTPRPAYQMVDTPVTPKVVLPATPNMIPAGPAVAIELVPESAVQAVADDVVQTTATEQPALPVARPASRFVPTVHLDEEGSTPIILAGNQDETLPAPMPSGPEVPPDQGQANPIVVNEVPMGGPAPCGCASCAGHHGGACGSKLHKLLAWFTYVPHCKCGPKCAPAPYIPRLYTFFLDHCDPAYGVVVPPPPH